MGILDATTKQAIAEILITYAEPSKYGYIISKESLEALTEEMFLFFKTCRDIKAKGDRMVTGDFRPTTETLKSRF